MVSSAIEFAEIPGAPQEVTVIETSQNNEMENGCVLLLQLSPPSNINSDDVDRYIIDYPSGQPITMRASSTTFVVSNCTRDLYIRVRAVNRCGVPGNSTDNIVPVLLPPEPGGVDQGLDASMLILIKVHIHVHYNFTSFLPQNWTMVCTVMHALIPAVQELPH